MRTYSGIRGASLVVIAGDLSTFNIPEAGIGLLLGIDPLPDMGPSAPNVLGNSIATAVVGKWEGELGKVKRVNFVYQSITINSEILPIQVQTCFMKKIFSSFFLFSLLFSLPVLGQAKQVKLKILNQYEISVSKLSFIENGRSTEIELAADGTGILNITGTDSIILKATDYSDLTVAASSLTEGNTIVMRKDFSWKDLINPMFYIVYGGLWLLLFIIFAETGLFAGFFLPGDSLLFVAGIYSGNLGHEFLRLVGMGAVHNDWLDLFVVIVLVTIAGILGNTAGYWFGKKIGPTMFHWKDNLLFKQKYLYHAKEFYDKHGGGAIVMARFLPIVRTFAPIVAGIVQMPRAKFAFFNVIGCVAWVSSMILAGHFLQQWIYSQFGFNLKEHLELIVIGIVFISTLPIILKLITGKISKKVKPV